MLLKPDRKSKIKPDKYIGIIINDFQYPFYSKIASGAMEYINNKGYSLIVLHSNNSAEHEKELSNIFKIKDIKGLIITPTFEDSTEIGYLFKLKLLNFPFVILEDVPGIQANIVSVDNSSGVYLAVKYLMDIGHTKIVHFAGPSRCSYSLERIDGFINAFSESELAFHKDMIIPVGIVFDKIVDKTIAYFEHINKSNYPTAIVCFNDYQAVAVITALKKLNIKVPEDISIIGNDGIIDEIYHPIPMTSIRTPLREMGMKSAEILIKNIEARKALPLERIIFNSQFIIRNSTMRKSLSKSNSFIGRNVINF